MEKMMQHDMEFKPSIWINNKTFHGNGELFYSLNPFNDDVVWQGYSADEAQVQMAVDAAERAFGIWKNVSFSQRQALVNEFAKKIEQNKKEFARVISLETGKPLWEAVTEVSAMIGKISISIRAYQERTGVRSNTITGGKTMLRHRPLGVMAVFAPYNFPAHLPNGHIVPALLAGNTVVLKPSEFTPMTAEKMLQLWIEAGLPEGVINLVQGGKETGVALVKADKVSGVLFTGSEQTGHALHLALAGRPEKMLALEMGGNNPLVVSKNYGDLDSVIYIIIQSAFISAGQRCTCARRLYLPTGSKGDEILSRLLTVTKSLKIGDAFDDDEPFYGSLISSSAAEHMLSIQAELVKQGGKMLLEGQILHHATITPSIIDVTEVKSLPDEEYFGPLLQVIRYTSYSQAVELANATRFGLSAGLISTNYQEWQYFLDNVHAGIVNRNRPITGASSDAPFGGVGASGNLRPSAFYAADYCAYPVASIESDHPVLPSKLSPGIQL